MSTELTQPAEQITSHPAQQAFRPPIITYSIVVACVVLTAAYQYPSLIHAPWWRALGTHTVMSGSEIWSGKYYGLLTSVFVHGGFTHILFNMMAFVTIGAYMEATMPPLGYVAFMALAGIIGSGAEMLADAQTGVGYSGVVYAMFGLLWAGRSHYPIWQQIANQQNMVRMVGWAVLCIVATYLNWFPVANSAHVAGFIFGLATGCMLWGWNGDAKPAVRAVATAIVAACIVIPVIAATWMPWSGDWYFYKGNSAFNKQRYPAAIAYYTKALKLGLKDGAPSDAWYNIGAAWNNQSILDYRAGKTQQADSDDKQQADAERREAQAKASEKSASGS